MNDRTTQHIDPNEKVLGVDIGMQMAEKFRQQHGRALPRDDVEFAGMLAIAFILGRESIAGPPKR